MLAGSSAETPGLAMVSIDALESFRLDTCLNTNKETVFCVIGEQQCRKMCSFSLPLFSAAHYAIPRPRLMELFVRGEFEPRCPPHTYWINCDKDGQEHDAARIMCQSSGGVRALTGYSSTGGNKCGYSTWQVLCNNSGAQNSGSQAQAKENSLTVASYCSRCRRILTPAPAFSLPG
jgi:hypothetical protein